MAGPYDISINPNLDANRRDNRQFDDAANPGQVRPVRDADMPDGMVSQPGVGDLEEEFREVTMDFDRMHKRVPQPMVDVEPSSMDLDFGGVDF